MAKTKREKTIRLTTAEWDQQLHNAREEGYRMGFKVGKDSERRAEEATQRETERLRLKTTIIDAAAHAVTAIAQLAKESR